MNEVIRNCKNYIPLEGIPEDEPCDEMPEPSQPQISASLSELHSQPEGENFPSDHQSSISPVPSILDDSENPMIPEGPQNIDFELPVEVPVPDDNDGELLFGDDLPVMGGDSGVWENKF